MQTWTSSTFLVYAKFLLNPFTFSGCTEVKVVSKLETSATISGMQLRDIIKEDIWASTSKNFRSQQENVLSPNEHDEI